jgi:hypothetical protein
MAEMAMKIGFDADSLQQRELSDKGNPPTEM